MQRHNDEVTISDLNEIAEILAKAVVRQLNRDADETSFDNSPDLAKVGLSSSENPCSL